MSHKKPRYDQWSGRPANRAAKREMGDKLEMFQYLPHFEAATKWDKRVEFGAIFQRPGEEPYFARLIQIGLGMPGRVHMRFVPLSRLRLSALQDSIQEASEHFKDRQLEVILDYLYAELDRRLNSGAAVSDFRKSLPLKPGQGYAEKELKKS